MGARTKGAEPLSNQRPKIGGRGANDPGVGSLGSVYTPTRSLPPPPCSAAWASRRGSTSKKVGVGA